VRHTYARWIQIDVRHPQPIEARIKERSMSCQFPQPGDDRIKALYNDPARHTYKAIAAALDMKLGTVIGRLYRMQMAGEIVPRNPRSPDGVSFGEALRAQRLVAEALRESADPRMQALLAEREREWN
jgi:hypothetical protein